MDKLNCGSQWVLVALLVAGLWGGTACKDKETDASKQGENNEVEKLVFAFQPQANPESISPDAKKLGDFLSEQIGVDVEIYLPTTYAGVVEALRSGNADVAYFSGWPYLVASKKANAQLLVAEVRNGNPFYHSHWYVLKDSDYQSLSDLEGKKASFTSPTSTSGYLFPVAKLIEQGALEKEGDPKDFFSEIIYAGGYQQSIRALLEGQVDAAAASGYALDLYFDEEQKSKIRTLTKQGPVPTHGVAVRGGVPDEIKTKIKRALLSLNKDKNKSLLKSVYGAEQFVEREHGEHVGPLQKALDLIGRGYGPGEVHQSDVGFGAGSGSGHGSGEAKGSGHGHGSGSGSGHGHGSGHGSGSAGEHTH